MLKTSLSILNNFNKKGNWRSKNNRMSFCILINLTITVCKNNQIQTQNLNHFVIKSVLMRREHIVRTIVSQPIVHCNYQYMLWQYWLSREGIQKLSHRKVASSRLLFNFRLFGPKVTVNRHQISPS